MIQGNTPLHHPHHHVSLLTPRLSPLWIKEPVAPGRLRGIMKRGTSLLSILLLPVIQYYNWLQGEHSSHDILN